MDTIREVQDSLTTQTYLLMPGHMNSAGVLFGGQLLMWIDSMAGIVGLRHADSQVVTAAIDHLEFRNEAHAGDVLTLEGRVTWVGHTSLEVRVDSWRENKGAQRVLINRAYLVMVAVNDVNRKPCPVPSLVLRTDEEKAEWDAGEKRNQLRKQRRKENY